MSNSLRPFSGPEYWRGSLSLLLGIFPTQGSNPSLPHCRWILYQLIHKGSPRILNWVAYIPSPVDLLDPGIELGSSSLQVDSLPTIRAAHGFNPWVWKIPWMSAWQPTTVFLPGESHRWRSLMDYSPWGRTRVGHNLATRQQQQQM